MASRNIDFGFSCLNRDLVTELVIGYRLCYTVFIKFALISATFGVADLDKHIHSVQSRFNLRLQPFTKIGSTFPICRPEIVAKHIG